MLETTMMDHRHQLLLILLQVFHGYLCLSMSIKEPVSLLQMLLLPLLVVHFTYDSDAYTGYHAVELVFFCAMCEQFVRPFKRIPTVE